jgi:hypothetical protein
VHVGPVTVVWRCPVLTIVRRICSGTRTPRPSPVDPAPQTSRSLRRAACSRAGARAQALCASPIAVAMGSVPGAAARTLEQRGREEGARAGERARDTRKCVRRSVLIGGPLSLTLRFFIFIFYIRRVLFLALSQPRVLFRRAGTQRTRPQSS